MKQRKKIDWPFWIIVFIYAGAIMAVGAALMLQLFFGFNVF